MTLTPAQAAAIGAPPANPADEYRYLASDLQTGAIIGDWIPITPQSFARQLNGTGQFQGALNLTAGSAAQQIAAAEQVAWRGSIASRRTVLWCLLNNVPVWNGITWDWQPQSILDGTMPFVASTMDSIAGYRVISDDLNFTGQDVFDVFRSLLNYALTKDIGTSVAGISLGSNESGIPVTISFAGSDMQLVSDAWSTLLSMYDFEYAFRPGFDASGNLVTYLDLGSPVLGLPFPQSALAYSMPGNLLDYQWTATGSSSANHIIATASGTDADGNAVTYTSQYPHGYDLIDLNSGAPLLEQAVSVTTISVTAQSQIDAYADGYLPMTTGTQLTPVLWLGNGQGPAVSDIVLGSFAQIALTSPLHPAGPDGQPGYQGQARITGWQLYPPTDQQAEYTLLNCWIPVPYLPLEGVGSGD
jgi:hypothetical protein